MLFSAPTGKGRTAATRVPLPRHLLGIKSVSAGAGATSSSHSLTSADTSAPSPEHVTAFSRARNRAKVSAAPRVPSGFRAAPSGNIPRAQQLLGWRGAIASETATRLRMLPSMGRIDPDLKQNGMVCRIYESVMG